MKIAVLSQHCPSKRLLLQVIGPEFASLAQDGVIEFEFFDELDAFEEALSNHSSQPFALVIASGQTKAFADVVEPYQLPVLIYDETDKPDRTVFPHWPFVSLYAPLHQQFIDFEKAFLAADLITEGDAEKVYTPTHLALCKLCEFSEGPPIDIEDIGISLQKTLYTEADISQISFRIAAHQQKSEVKYIASELILLQQMFATHEEAEVALKTFNEKYFKSPNSFSNGHMFFSKKSHAFYVEPPLSYQKTYLITGDEEHGFKVVIFQNPLKKAEGLYSFINTKGGLRVRPAHTNETYHEAIAADIIAREGMLELLSAGEAVLKNGKVVRAKDQSGLFVSRASKRHLGMACIQAQLPLCRFESLNRAINAWFDSVFGSLKNTAYNDMADRCPIKKI